MGGKNLSTTANVNAENEQINEALLAATARWRTEDVKAAIAAGADVNTRDEYGYTALIHAACNCKPEIVQILIDAGADLNLKDEDREVGKTPLMHAIYHDRSEAVEILINAKADVNAKDKDGKTALDYAPVEERNLIQEIFKKAKYDREGLKIDNKLARRRKEIAKNVGLGAIPMPEWVKEAEARASKLFEAMTSKKSSNKVKTTGRDNSAER